VSWDNRECLGPDCPPHQEALSVESLHTFRANSAVFDETNFVSSAGQVLVLELGEQAGLSELIDVHVDIDSVRVKSGAANPAGKLTSIIAGMCTGADYIDDMNLLRAGGMPALFDQVYAPSTLGIFLREFSFGHSLQLGAVLRRHLIALAARTALLPGIEDRAFLDIDSLLRPVYGHQKQGASYGHANIAGRALLRKGLSPLVTALSTAASTPVVAEMRLRAGKTGSGRGAASQLRSAITTARACGTTGKIMARGDSAFGNKAVIGAAIAGGIDFSLVMTRNPRITRVIDGIGEQAWTPVHYPGAVTGPRYRGVDLRRGGRRSALHGVLRVFPPREVDTSSYAAVASLADRCSYSIGQIWPRVECLLLVLYRVIQRKTAARASPALFQRFRPCNVSRFDVAFSDRRRRCPPTSRPHPATWSPPTRGRGQRTQPMHIEPRCRSRKLPHRDRRRHDRRRPHAARR